VPRGLGQVHGLLGADAAVFRALYAHPPWGAVRALARLVLRVSGGGACWLVLFGLLFLFGGRRGRRIALTGALAVLVAHAVAVWGLSGLVQRPGPAAVLPGVVPLLPRGTAFSFPSGRVAGAFAAAPFLMRGSGAGPAAVALLALAIAWAGVYGGLNFPTDALAGAAVGLAAAGAAVWILGDPFRRRHGALVPLRRPPAGRGAPRSLRPR
jgi:membrane-associated phospholipid phosphatase